MVQTRQPIKSRHRWHHLSMDIVMNHDERVDNIKNFIKSNFQNKSYKFKIFSKKVRLLNQSHQDNSTVIVGKKFIISFKKESDLNLFKLIFKDLESYLNPPSSTFWVIGAGSGSWTISNGNVVTAITV